MRASSRSAPMSVMCVRPINVYMPRVKQRKSYHMLFFKKKQGRAIPICIFCYHKVGTVLLSKVFRQISEARNWKLQSLLGKQTQLPQDTDVILLGHSLIDLDNITTPFIGIHIIRDPRDIIVSGYLYHRRTSEKWCVNSDFSLTSPILFPKIPYSQEHRSEEWKIKYLESLRGMSYQENLLSMSQGEGLLFEMNNYGAWTIESMMNWNYDRNNILEIKFENLMHDFDDTFRLIFEFLKFSRSEIKAGSSIASEHDLGRKSAQDIEKMEHVSSTKTTKWKDYFEPDHKEKFINKFGNVLVDLGYEKNNSW